MREKKHSAATARIMSDSAQSLSASTTVTILPEVGSNGEIKEDKDESVDVVCFN